MSQQEQQTRNLVANVFRIIRGLDDAVPFAVGFARGAAEAIVFGGLAAFGVYVMDFDFTVLGIPEDAVPYVVGAFLWGKRSLEGVADQIDPAKKSSSE